MEEKFEFFEKIRVFSSLHMKGNSWFSKNEKYFDFSKMDKKNVQKSNLQNLLTEKFFCLDKKILSSQIKRINIFI
jgi:hypothetical protein